MNAQGLADFVIIGEMKCGTTSVAHHLDEHPTIHVSPTRPVRFFDERWSAGLDWYAAQFAAASPGQIRGDDTPNYLFDQVAVDRLATTLPDVKVIVLLREPIARAWSHHCHHQRTGFDRRPFRQAVLHELSLGVGAHGTPEGSAYVARGCYDVTLGRLFGAVDRSRVHVELFDDLTADPGGVVRRLHEFLGVDAGFVPAGLETVYNVGWTARSQRLNAAAFRLSGVVGRLAHPLMRANARPVSEPELDATLRARLVEHYSPHLEALPALLERTDLPAWATGGAG